MYYICFLYFLIVMELVVQEKYRPLVTTRCAALALLMIQKLQVKHFVGRTVNKTAS